MTDSNSGAVCRHCGENIELWMGLWRFNGNSTCELAPLPDSRHEPAPAEQPRVCPKCDDEGCDYCNADPKLSTSPVDWPRGIEHPEFPHKLPCGCTWQRTKEDLIGPIFWNPFNHAVQCHQCGQSFGPAAQPSPDAAKVGEPREGRQSPLGNFAGTSTRGQWIDDPEESAAQISAKAHDIARDICTSQGWFEGSEFWNYFYPKTVAILRGAGQRDTK